MTEIRYYLEMNGADELRPARHPQGDVEVKRQERPDPGLSRSLYGTVGDSWRWVDRLSWTDEEWLAYLDRLDIETWVMWSRDEPAGYFELEEMVDGSIKVAYFGLMPEFVGCGLGGHLLTVAVRRAWAMRARRVWLHTSSYDHPHALDNYQARGFRVCQTEQL